MSRLSICDTDCLKNKSEKLWSRDFVVVMLACAGISFCNYFLVSTLPIYAQKLTGTSVYAGLMTTIYTLAALATRPFAGLLSDRFGRVRLLIAGAAICAIACIFYRFTAAIVVLILVRALQGIGFGIHTTAGGTVAADIVPKSRMSEGLGIFGLYGTIASALAPAIALGIIGNGDIKNFEPLFLLSASIAFVCIILDSLIRYERTRRKPKHYPLETMTADAQQVPSHEEAAVLPKTVLGFEPAVFVPGAVLALIFIAFSSVISFLTLFALDRNLGNIGLFFTINAVGMLCSRLFLGKVADKRGADIIVLPSLVVMILCFVLIPFIHLKLHLLLLAFPLGLTQGAICPVINTMMFRRCSVKRRGTASAAYFAAIDLGFACGALFFGFIADKLGYSAVYWSAMLFVLAASVIYILMLRQKK